MYWHNKIYMLYVGIFINFMNLITIYSGRRCYDETVISIQGEKSTENDIILNIYTSISRHL